MVRAEGRLSRHRDPGRDRKARCSCWPVLLVAGLLWSPGSALQAQDELTGPYASPDQGKTFESFGVSSTENSFVFATDFESSPVGSSLAQVAVPGMSFGGTAVNGAVSDSSLLHIVDSNNPPQPIRLLGHVLSWTQTELSAYDFGDPRGLLITFDNPVWRVAFDLAQRCRPGGPSGTGLVDNVDVEWGSFSQREDTGLLRVQDFGIGPCLPGDYWQGGPIAGLVRERRVISSADFGTPVRYGQASLVASTTFIRFFVSTNDGAPPPLDFLIDNIEADPVVACEFGAFSIVSPAADPEPSVRAGDSIQVSWTPSGVRPEGGIYRVHLVSSFSGRDVVAVETNETSASVPIPGWETDYTLQVFVEAQYPCLPNGGFETAAVQLHVIGAPIQPLPITKAAGPVRKPRVVARPGP